MISGVEQEIVRATEFEPDKPYKERQDHLAALLRAATDLSDEAFYAMTQEAQKWCDDNATRFKNKEVLIDFEGQPVVVVDELSKIEIGKPLTYEEPVADEPYPVAEEGSKKAKRSHRKVEPPKAKFTGILDDFGMPSGSKNSQVAAMLQVGTTQKDIKAKHGQTYYNLVKKLGLQGHKVEKNGDFVKVTPKGS